MGAPDEQMAVATWFVWGAVALVLVVALGFGYILGGIIYSWFK